MNRTSLCLALALSTVAATAAAQDSADDLVCADEPPELALGPYLRALSLDLRGVVASPAEIEAARDESMLRPILDEWMESGAFADRIVRRHRALLWNDVSTIALLSPAASLTRGTSSLYFVSSRSPGYRGVQINCVDQPATFDEFGRPEILVDEMVGSVMAHREGYVMVRPYWAPDTEIKMCAFDAQAAPISGRGVQCASIEGLTDTGCGCGPSAERCAPPEVLQTMARSLGLELEERIRAIVEHGEGYASLFESRRAFVNGPLVHYYRHLAFAPSTVRFLPLALDATSLPDLPYSDDAWTPIELPTTHAGVLTSPAYLLRFQTNRARASRFYDAFLCEPFTPPSGGIPASTEEEARQVDLQLRSGCRYCHAQLEPAASHWGRWAEQGAAFLGEVEYPSYREDCYECAVGRYACPTSCSLRYVTQAFSPEERPYLGMLRAYEFRREEHEPWVEEGPARLVHETLADGRLPRCVARRTAEWMLGRELGESEAPWLDSLTQTFVASDLDYRELIASIALSGTYRRAR